MIIPRVRSISDKGLRAPAELRKEMSDLLTGATSGRYTASKSTTRYYIKESI